MILKYDSQFLQAGCNYQNQYGTIYIILSLMMRNILPFRDAFILHISPLFSYRPLEMMIENFAESNAYRMVGMFDHSDRSDPTPVTILSRCWSIFVHKIEILHLRSTDAISRGVFLRVVQCSNHISIFTTDGVSLLPHARVAIIDHENRILKCWYKKCQLKIDVNTACLSRSNRFIVAAKAMYNFPCSTYTFN